MTNHHLLFDPFHDKNPTGRLGWPRFALAPQSIEREMKSCLLTSSFPHFQLIYMAPLPPLRLTLKGSLQSIVCVKGDFREFLKEILERFIY